MMFQIEATNGIYLLRMLSFTTFINAFNKNNVGIGIIAIKKISKLPITGTSIKSIKFLFEDRKVTKSIRRIFSFQKQHQVPKVYRN